MSSVCLLVEGCADVRDASLSAVEAALGRMAMPKGPTYIILEDEEHFYMQAAGTEGRYVIEARDIFGEGFKHWRAARQPEPSGIEAQVYFLNECRRGKYPSRKTPLKVDAAEVLRFDDVVEAITLFARTHERLEDLYWLDASAEFLRSAGEKEIEAIRPRGRREDGNG